MKKAIAWFLAIGAAALVALVALFPAETASLAINFERSQSGLAAGSVSVDGETWPYLEGGARDGEVLVLLHGFGGDKDNWVRFARTLTDDYRLVIPDLPGFGDTARDRDRDYSAQAQAERVHGFVRAMQLERMHLVGHSMGGHIAALYAHRHPERIATLTLVTNAGINSPRESYVSRRAAEGDMVLIPRSHDEFRRLIEVASFEPPFIPWPLTTVLADEAIADADFKELLLRFLRDDQDAELEPLLPEISAPVFVLWGRHDRLIDVSTVDVIRQLIPDAHVVIMENAGHLPILEHPGEAAGHLRDFLDATRQ